MLVSSCSNIRWIIFSSQYLLLGQSIENNIKSFICSSDSISAEAPTLNNTRDKLIVSIIIEYNHSGLMVHSNTTCTISNEASVLHANMVEFLFCVRYI